jgi:hypothetical protein
MERVSKMGLEDISIGCGGLTHGCWESDGSSLPMILEHLMFQQLAQYSCVSDVVG